MAELKFDRRAGKRKCGGVGFPIDRGNDDDSDSVTPEIEAQLAAEAKDRGTALNRYIETIVEARPTGQIRRRSVGEAVNVPSIAQME